MTALLTALHLAWTALAAVVVTRRTRNPASAGVWLLLVFALPVAGTLLYVLAGWHDTRTAACAAPAGNRHPLAALIGCGCGTRTAPHNRIDPLHNGSNAFAALIASLQRATRSIHMEYYIFRNDRIGRTIAAILMRKARAGVEVRVIYDAVGSWRLGRRLRRDLRRAGVEIRPYAPIRFPWFTPRTNRRNHRKIVVTDGRTAYLGGINIAKYYLDGDGMGKWRDEHLRIEGDAVADLQRLFLADWARSGGPRLDPAHYVAPHRIADMRPMQIAWAEEGPSRTTLADAFASVIHRAHRTIRLSSPYFMPPPCILDALRIASRRGVRVAVMIPTCSDSRITDLASESYAADLLEAGAELYRYDNGFLHAKLLVADDTVASVGTANMDYRSLQDNLEVTAFVYDRATAASLAATFDRDLEHCVRIRPDTWRRTPLRRIASDLLRLLSPLP